MRIRGLLTKIWAYVGIAIVLFVIVFLFAFVFWKGSSTISWEFLSEPPSGMVLGSEGGILPAITGSLAFTLTAIVIGAIPAIATALYLVFFCKSQRTENLIHLVVQCIAGIPSIVLGLFAYSLFVRDLKFGRCILSSGIALGIMVLPFIEVRAEKAFRELSAAMIRSAYALGCTKTHTILTVVLPACRGELFSGIILGGCYAMGATAPMPFPFSVYKNLAYAPKYYGIRNKKELDRIVKEKLQMVGLYDEIKDDLGKSALKFSGGQQQRICIARALTVEPDVLLLDEPCSALDVRSISVIEETLLKLKEKYTIIIVTHNIAQARRLSDRVAFLKDGHLVEEGDADPFFKEPKDAETREFLRGIYG